MLFGFEKARSTLFSFRKLHDETLIHLLSNCNQVATRWIEIIATKGNDKSFLIQNTISVVTKLCL